RVHVAKHLHHAGIEQPDDARLLTLTGAAEVERRRRRGREHVVQERIGVGEGDPRPFLHDQDVGDERAIFLDDLDAAFDGRLLDVVHVDDHRAPRLSLHVDVAADGGELAGGVAGGRRDGGRDRGRGRRRGRGRGRRESGRRGGERDRGAGGARALQQPEQEFVVLTLQLRQLHDQLVLLLDLLLERRELVRRRTTRFGRRRGTRGPGREEHQRGGNRGRCSFRAHLLPFDVFGTVQ